MYGGGPHINGLDSTPAKVEVEVDFLIIGVGPAGASLACFLVQHGLKGLVICAAPSTADTPRAHITNMAALECLRDIGLEDDCIKAGSAGNTMKHTRWCHSMAGTEYARVYSWGADPDRKGDYEKASPCEPLDLPQTLLEPILTKHALANGFSIRFDTYFQGFEELARDNIVSHIKDGLTNKTYHIRSRYLFGADGARSRIQKQLALPLHAKAAKGLAINVLVKADLSHYIESRMGNLHFVLQPDKPHPLFGWLSIARMIKPWNEWIFILFPGPGAEERVANTTDADYTQHISNLIGDPSISVNVLGVSRWNINEIAAEQYSRGNIFCLGDAVHRHPPMNGLGSNTSVQDAYNLAWKVAYVEKGIASPKLLDTYSVERQPVGLAIVTRANEAFGRQCEVWDTLGLTTPDVEARKKALDELTQSTGAGSQRRRAFREAIQNTRAEFHGLGIEMAQVYQSSAIIEDETIETTDPKYESHPLAQDHFARALVYVPSTKPGRRLPHVWLHRLSPNGLAISTQDLAGKASFCLFTGHGGDAWKSAARHACQELKIPVNAYSIGHGLDWHDVYFDWERVRGVEESGCVLVRPDRFVAWRCPEVLGDEEACIEKLSAILRGILGTAS